MSKLDEQCAELRELAKEADTYGDTRHYRDPLEKAADTIDALAEFIRESLLTTKEYAEKYGLNNPWDAVAREAAHARARNRGERMTGKRFDWDDALLYEGCLIGYAVGVKAASEDVEKSELLVKMAELQKRIDWLEAKNVALQKLVKDMYDIADGSYRYILDYEELDMLFKRMRWLGIEVDE